MATRTWTDEQLVAGVEIVCTFKDLMIYLGLKPGGGSEAKVRSRIKEMNLDTAHFRKGGFGRYQKPDHQLFLNGVPFNTNHRRRFLKITEYRCLHCGLFEWNGERLVLQLDHVDGDRSNNSLENLRLLCPNCHSQTDTWSRQKHCRT